MNRISESTIEQSDRIENNGTYTKSASNWMINRMRLEALRFGRLSKRALENGKVSRLDYFLPYFTLGLKAAFLYDRGVRNARNIVIKEHELFFDDLPEAFDGYRILHVTDLHLDSLPGLEEAVCDRRDGEGHG